MMSWIPYTALEGDMIIPMSKSGNKNVEPFVLLVLFILHLFLIIFSDNNFSYC